MKISRFGVALLDLDRENQLLHLPLEGVGKGLLAFRREPELLLEVARELLRQRAGALRPPHLDDVGQRGGADAPDVDAEMAVELRVFGRDDRLPQQRVDVVVADDDAPLGGELADQLVVGRVDARDGAGGVVVERGDLRKVAGVREEHAAQDAGQGGGDEQRDDPGAGVRSG